MHVRITVMPKGEILDPQGKAISKSLQRMGFPHVHNVRQGKVITMDLVGSDPVQTLDNAKQICEKLLVNPVMETYHIEVGKE